jgi:branched-chain amino acid transport system permease protein
MGQPKIRFGRSPWRWEEPAFWAGLAAAGVFFPGYFPLLTQIAGIGIFAVSLDLLVGYGGIASLGHAVYFGIGAYASGALMQRGWGEPISGLLVAGIASAAMGYLFSFLLYKVRAIALLVVTLGWGLFVLELATQLKPITGGEDGLQGLTVWPLLQVFEWDYLGQAGFIYAYVVCLLLYLLVRIIMRSNFGMAVEAIRENEVRAKAIGIPAVPRLRTLFVVSTFVAGAAGALYAQTTQFVALEVLSLDRSVSALVMVTLGGTGTTLGAMVGAATFLWARDVFATLAPVYWNFWIGLLLFLVVCLGQDGVLGLSRKIFRRRLKIAASAEESV